MSVDCTRRTRWLCNGQECTYRQWACFTLWGAYASGRYLHLTAWYTGIYSDNLPRVVSYHHACLHIQLSRPAPSYARSIEHASVLCAPLCHGEGRDIILVGVAWELRRGGLTPAASSAHACNGQSSRKTEAVNATVPPRRV